MTVPTPSTRRTAAPRLGRAIAFGLALALALLALAPTGQAGPDDFEFGKRLAQARFFDYAREVYEGLLSDPKATEEEKGLALYGMALLRQEEAIAATGQDDKTFDDIAALFESAADDIEAFVKKNPTNKNADMARLDVGKIRLAFVQWIRELLSDPGEIQDRGYQVGKLREAASKSVGTAIKYFGDLRPDPSKVNTDPHKDLANYYYVISQYYKALVEEPCSDAAKRALQKAGDLLEEYIMDHDGQLLAIYAQDIYGLVWWELARCADGEDEKTDYYSKAFEWFRTCIDTEDEGPDFLRVITSGYYHLAQAGLDAGRMPKQNFERQALELLEDMLRMHPTAWRTDNGLRAMIEHSKLECARGDSGRAVQRALDAAERAKAAGKPVLERMANRQLNIYVAGGCGGSVGGLEPDVLARVADDLRVQEKYPDAIRAYRSVIKAAPNTTQGFVAHQWSAWENMARCYEAMGDLLGQALAYEAIHEAWMNGLIPRIEGDQDPNQERAARSRMMAQRALKSLSETTRSKVFEAKLDEIADHLTDDYPDTNLTETVDWNRALRLFKTASEEKQKKNPAWKKTLAEALAIFEKFAGDAESRVQEMAWVYLVRSHLNLEAYDAAIKKAQEALASWNAPEQLKQEEKFETIRGRRRAARAYITYWLAAAYGKEANWAKVVETLTNYDANYAGVTPPYPSLALGALIEAHLELGNIADADALYRTLLRRDPGFDYLPQITFKFADQYKEELKNLESELRDVKSLLNERRSEFSVVDKDKYRLAATLGDLKGQLETFRKARELYDKGEKVDDTLMGAVLEEEKTRKTANRVAELEPLLQKTTTRHAELETEIAALFEKRHELEQRIYEPLTSAAGYYKLWDDSLKVREKDEGVALRDPENLQVFGYMWWQAGRLRPEEVANWQNAVDFYEDYRNSPKVKKIPDTDDAKRAAIARLGDAYVNLSLLEKDPAQRRELVTRAVDLLQGAIAKEPSDNQLVVNMLADKVLVLRWKDPSQQNKEYRFAIPKPASVDEFRAAVANLGKDDDPFRPTFEDNREERDWSMARDKFRRDLTGYDDAWVAKTVEGAQRGSFDPSLFKQLANAQTEFRLALAWAYAMTGRDEDVPKAMNLAVSLTRGVLQADENSEAWWRAQEILMMLYLNTSERYLAGGAGASEASVWLDRAKKLFLRTAASSPLLGEDVVEGNKERWMKVLDRMNDLRLRAGMPGVSVSQDILEAEAEEEKTE